MSIQKSWESADMNRQLIKEETIVLFINGPYELITAIQPFGGRCIHIEA